MSNVALVQVSFNNDDPASTLKVVTKPIPKPAPGQVVVHIKLRPINPSDFNNLLMGGLIEGGRNGTPGSEGFGIVHEVGEGVTTLHEGQRVIPVTMFESYTGNGSFQKYICINANHVLPVPDDISDEIAAQFLVNPLTSYSILKDLQVPKGQYMIQSAAGSVLGKQVITLAKHWGIKSINVVRRSEQKAELKALGADEVICSTDEDVVARVKEITGGKGAWGALDPVGGTITGMLASCVRDGGQMFIYGVLGGFTLTMGTKDLFRGVSLQGWVLFRKGIINPEILNALYTEILPLVRHGIISVAEVEKHDLTDFKQALAKAAEPGRSGKILLVSA
ncbi:hypothetical protein M758_8G069500 [Ceratodon purpureus]|nr:hypothetical protein M758_8G069500 [Ceratodon purpureus]